jgi:hypothetical protein
LSWRNCGIEDLTTHGLRASLPASVFLGISALLFAAGVAVTIVWCASMSAIGGMPMPGRWTMSMACRAAD